MVDHSRGASTPFFANPAVWDEIYGRRDVNAVVHQDRLAQAIAIIDQLGLPPGAKALDVGCGAGQLTVALAQRQLQVVAVDRQSEMLVKAHRRLDGSGMGDRVTQIQVDALCLPFPEARFDLVVALGVLPWVTDPSACLAEMVRVLRPGGALLVTTSNRLRLTWLLDPLLSPALARPRRQVKRLLARLGRDLSRQPAPEAKVLSAREFRGLVAANDAEVVQAQTIGFGPFTLFGRPLLADRPATRLHRLLQSGADKHVRALTTTGAQHVVLARKRGVSGSGSSPKQRPA